MCPGGEKEREAGVDGHASTSPTAGPLTFHPVANLFPLMPEAEPQALVGDIAQNGLFPPIWLYQAQIIDGRNWY